MHPVSCILGILQKPYFERRWGIFSAEFGRTTSGCSVNGSLLRGKFHIQEGGGKYYLRLGGQSGNWKKKEIGNVLVS